MFNELFHPNTTAKFQKSWQEVKFPVELGNLHLPAMVGTAAQTSTGTKEILQVESRKQYVYEEEEKEFNPLIALRIASLFFYASRRVAVRLQGLNSSSSS